MSATQVTREPCRQIFHRPRIPTLSTSRIAIDSIRPARREFSRTSAARADDDGGEKDSSRVRQAKEPTRLRRRMYSWLNGPGRAFTHPLPGSTNYLSAYTPDGRLYRQKDRRRGGQDGEHDGESGQTRNSRLPQEREEDFRPYPLNEHFVSEAVLSDRLKDAIYRRVVINGRSVSAVSAELCVDMRRVAAVVRLKEVEKKWEKNGTQFADSYANAVMNMLPQTRYNAAEPVVHESINDLPVHPATKQQIFYPTSESREFTRRDAAKIFSPSLLPADQRVPHPELIEAERGPNAQLSDQDKDRLAEKLRQAAATAKAKADKQRQAAEAARTKVVKGSRWNFKFETINANVAAGKDGRSSAGVGWRYGMPYEDRKRGHLKGVPTKVEV